LHTSDKILLPTLFRKSFDLLFLIAVPIGLGLFVIADQLVVLLFGPGFAGSGPALAIMGIVLIMLYQNILIGRFLISIDRQNTWTVVMVIAVIATVALDLALIPWSRHQFQNGAIGGALSYLITELGMTIAGIALLPKGYLDRSNAFLGLRALFAGAVMVGVTFLCRDIFILVPIVVGAVTYIGLIILMRLVPTEDILEVVNIARSFLGKVRPNKPQTSEVS
jgi:O-antigen/teichoic acid export membrane protein